MSLKSDKLVPRPWRAQRNPWTPDDELARVLILRGAILWAYAEVEQALTELMIRVSHVEPYREIAERAPFPMSKRLDYLRKAIALDGPLTPYAGLIAAILNRLEGSRGIRNQMAHSAMQVIGVGPVKFREIEIMGGEITQKWVNFYPGQLEGHARRAARFSRAVQRLKHRLDWVEELLPRLE